MHIIQDNFRYLSNKLGWYLHLICLKSIKKFVNGYYIHVYCIIQSQFHLLWYEKGRPRCNLKFYCLRKDIHSHIYLLINDKGPYLHTRGSIIIIAMKKKYIILFSCQIIRKVRDENFVLVDNCLDKEKKIWFVFSPNHTKIQLQKKLAFFKPFFLSYFCMIWPENKNYISGYSWEDPWKNTELVA